MDIVIGSAINLVTGVANFMFQKVGRHCSYLFHHRRRVSNLEKKFESLTERRDRVQHDVDAAEKNGENIHTDVKSWLIQADNIINAELKDVKGLEDKANNKCFIGLCPNFKARHQLSKKAEEDASAVDELLRQGGLDKVSYRDVPPPRVDAPPKDFEAFDSRKQVFNEIVEAVKDPSINIIGVYGMAGVGKTTLVKEVVRQVEEYKLFDSVVMAAVTQTPDIKKIQDQIADKLGLKFEEQSMTGRANRLCARLKEEKILVVLDDIWAKLDPTEVGISFGDEHQGCTMLLISRVLDVLSNGMGAEKSFRIEVLTTGDAWNLFKKMAGDSVESPDLQSIATEVAKKCAGLPIAISTVARALRNKPLFEWRDALRQLNKPSSSNFKGVPAEAYLAIELSYNHLESEEHKQTFLLCGLMGHNARNEYLLRYAMGLGLFHGVSTVDETRDRVLTVVSHLKSSCLLLDSYNNQLFDMHDLMCDVAISIASKDNRVFVLRHGDVLDDWPNGETMKECNKISLMYASIGKLPDQFKCPKLIFFNLCRGSKDPSMEMPTNFFQEMENLKVLALTKMYFPSLPSSISLLSNLRTLCLAHCVLGDIVLIGELNNLEILSLLHSDIEILPKEIGQLIKLKLLDLSRSKLQRFPSGVLCNLSKLEELYMGNSFVQWEAGGHPSEQSNASLTELKALSCLTALDIHITDAKIIPKDFFFEKLQRYNIFIGEAWDWNWFGDIEYSRTLKLKLQTSIGFLNHGMKALLKKAENLHLDEMKGMEILLPESEARQFFQQLKNLHIQNGAMIQNIIKVNDAVHKIEFPQLLSLTLQDLPKLISFCSENNGSTSISPLGKALFDQKIVFPKLEKLKLFSISIERIWLPRGFHATKNLTSLIIEGCTNLKHVLSYSIIEHLQQLICLEITECKCVQEIISTEKMTKEAFGIRAPLSFPRLNSLKLKGLQKLIGFCHEDYIVEFPSLTILEIEYCPDLKEFINNSTGKSTSTDEVFFNEKVAFPNLEKITMPRLRNVKRIWRNQLHGDSFSKLKELKIEYCDALLNIFSSFLLGAFQKLETVTIADCASIQEVFQVQVQGLDTEGTSVVATQVRQVNLTRLPNLKHVWDKDSEGNISFENLRSVYVWKCWSLKSLFPFSIARNLLQLESLIVSACGVEEIISKNIGGAEQEIWFKFNQLSFLVLWDLPNLVCFYSGMHTTTWPMLKKLRHRCKKIKIFGQTDTQIQQPLFLIEKVIPQLEEVSFSSDDITMLSVGQFAVDFFCRIKLLQITSYLSESDGFPFCFLQRFYNLEKLEVHSCNFKELSYFEGEEKDVIITLPKIKKLKFHAVNKIRYLWKQDSPLDHICACLETLEVWGCDSLINLSSASSSFQNLTTLDVWNCKEIAELITSSKAQSLERLVTLRIRECEMVTEVIASEGHEAAYEIIFRELKYLKLHCLQSLDSFCSGNYAFEFPSLEQVLVSQCPAMKNFCHGALSTPKLQKVQLIETDNKGHWVGDLNATVKQLYMEQVGYRGLKHLNFSKFPELMDIWSRNPQEMLDFKNLKFLEVCNSNNLRCLFNLSMAMSLGLLRRMEIKRCSQMKQVIKEEGSVVEEATANNKIIGIFPRLQSIIVESCPDLTSFYLGSTTLECPSLTKIEVANCPNMTTFVSSISREEDEEATIGDEIDTVTAFFCNKVAFPNLEKITMSRLRNVKRIWRNQLHGDSFSKLKELKVEYCDALLNIFSSFLLGVFQKLEIVTITDCASIQEVFQVQVQGLDTEGTSVVATQVRQVNLTRLPKLKHVWDKDPNGNISFENLRNVYVRQCWSLKSLFPFSITRDLLQLQSLTVIACGVEEIISKNIEGVKQEIWFQFNQLSFLKLWNLPNLLCFYPGMHTTTWPVLKKLRHRCKKIKIFGQTDTQIQQPLFLIEKVIPQLEEVSFSSDDITMLSVGQFAVDFFCRIKLLQITSYLSESDGFLLCFLQRFYNLEKLEVHSCNFKELSYFEGEEKDVIITLPKIKKLKFRAVNKIRYLWKQDSPLDHICACLETLKVWECDSLINLSSASSSFQNLTTLDVWKCKEIAELITSSKAQSLERLVTLRIRECEMVTEVIASDGHEAAYEIIFKELKYLKLHCLQSLNSFCSGNCAFEFPSLEQVIVSQCPTMKNFCHGALSTPKLQKIQLVETDNMGHWVGDLNATVKQLYMEQVGYRGLKHLNFSKFPELMDIWSRNPQEMSDFKNLEFLEVCNSNNLRCLFNLSMATSLGLLQRMEIKRCSQMKQVIEEEGSVVEEATATCKIISIFPRLESIIVESCPDLTSFYLGSTNLECPSLIKIEVANCPNMTTFVSSISRQEDEEAVIGDEIDTVAAFFCNKVVFPSLEKIAISYLRNVRKIWCNQLYGNSFSKLKELKVKYCDALLNIFSSFLLGALQKLEIVTITDCASIQEVFQVQVQVRGLDTEGTCVVATQLRQVNLTRLPKLEHVWDKDPNGNISFENLRNVYVEQCWSLKSLFPFSIARDLLQLESLTVMACGMEEIISKNIEGEKREIWFQFNQLSFLKLWNLPDLVCFYPGMHTTTWPVLKKLRHRCKKIKIFGQAESQIQQPLFLIEKVIPQLEEVSFSSDDITMLSVGQFAVDFFCRIKLLQITSYLSESDGFPFCFLQRFYNLEKLEVHSCNFKELSYFEGDVGEEKDVIITLPKIKKLKFHAVNKIRYLWKQDSPLDHICACLETLEVWGCDSLINLSSASSSFQNLTTLDVWNCKEIAELITSSKAQSLERLVTLRIRECEMVTEVIASEGHEAAYEIIFKELKYLKLHCLQSLNSFCSGNYAFEFPSLEQVIVSQCPTMKNFCHGALSTPKLQKIQLVETDNMGHWVGDLNATVKQLYMEQVGYRGLKHLNFSKFPELMDIWSRNPQEMSDFKNLKFLEVCNSNNLRCLFNLSMAMSLGLLQRMEIKRCSQMKQVIKEEGSVVEEATANNKIIGIFPRLQSIIVESCPDLTSFYLGSTTLECPSLTKIEVANCPNMTTFVSSISRKVDEEAIIGDEIDTVTAFFCNKAAFPNLEKITMSRLRNVKRIWRNQLHGDSFCKLKELKVEYCDALLNIFSSFLLGIFQKLEIVTIADCASIQEVFQVQVQGLDTEGTSVVATQVRQVYLTRLPNLKHVWDKDPNGNISFENLRKVYVRKCWSLKSLFPFSITRDLLQLQSLTVIACGVEEIISKNIEGVKQEIWFQFNQLSFLKLWNLPNLLCFYPGMHTTTWPVLKKLRHRCKKIKIFGQTDTQIQQPLFLIEKAIPQLEEVSFSSDDISMISVGQFAVDFFYDIKLLLITCYLNESDAFPFCFLQRFYNLEMLEVHSCNFRELSPFEGDVGEEKDMVITLPKIKKLKLVVVNKIRYLWKQDSLLDCICASLKTLEVWMCDNLINLSSASSSFQNLTTLDVWKCKEITELITSLKAQSLAQLVTMRIRECEMMTEVIASEEDEATYDIIFRELRCLELHCLQSLKSFCSENDTFKFPSLEQVIVSQCPTMKNFCQGALITPKLQKVQLTKIDYKGRWVGDLNSTVKQLYIEQVGYHGLKHLKFSKFPELMDIWSRNPQEMLDFKNLEFLEVCNSNNLRCVFNLSTAMSLGRLQQMEIKRCSQMEQVIKEEGSVLEEATKDNKIISIFPYLQSIIVESCPDLTSFYLGNAALECRSLSEIKVVNCPKMTSFVSTFSRDKDEEAIIDDETDTVTAFFCNKVAFPNLEKVTISHLRNVKKIGCNQLHKDSFSKLKELKVEYCDALLDIFSSFLLRVFQSLEILTVTNCASLEEVFQLQVQGLDTKKTCVVGTQLRQVFLIRLPKLKHVWNMDPNGNISFENLQDIDVWECRSLKTLFPFSIAKSLQRLESLTLCDCGVEEIVSKNIEGVEQGIWFQFNQLSFFSLWELPNLICFYQGMHNTTWPVLKKLRTHRCEKIKIFGEIESQIQQPLFLIEKVIPQLEEVSFSSDDIAMICDGKFAIDFFYHIKHLRITCYLNESDVFPFCFLQRFQNLEMLEVVSCNFKELSPYESDVGEDKDMIITLPAIKKLKLDGVDKIRYLWKQDSPLDHICACLETLEVFQCYSLINLSLASSSFQNLTTLDVWKCKEIAELITSSKAHSLVRLVTMRIRECEMMTEVIASEEDEATYEIVFKELKCLELHCLRSLKSFCSGNYAYKFPSLEQVIVNQCPTMNNFCQGALSTPQLQKVQLSETDFKGRWFRDLNATIEQLNVEECSKC